LKESFNTAKSVSGLKGKPLFMGLRVSATHLNHGPDLMSTLYLLGRDVVESRLKAYVGL
jgi:nondiscriminating glutamyl-tRNA synthetase